MTRVREHTHLVVIIGVVTRGYPKMLVLQYVSSTAPSLRNGNGGNASTMCA